MLDRAKLICTGKVIALICLIKNKNILFKKIEEAHETKGKEKWGKEIINIRAKILKSNKNTGKQSENSKS